MNEIRAALDAAKEHLVGLEGKEELLEVDFDSYELNTRTITTAHTVREIDAALADLDAQEQRLRDLEAALRPFANLADDLPLYWHDDARMYSLFDDEEETVTVGDVRRAAEVLGGEQ